MFKNELPGGVHPSGLVVVAFIFLLGYWIATHREKVGSVWTTDDIGAGGGIRPIGWTGEYFQAPDDMQHEDHFRRVVFSREPAYHQPQVVQEGRKTNWYKFIDLITYRQKPPFLERRSYP